MLSADYLLFFGCGLLFSLLRPVVGCTPSLRHDNKELAEVPKPTNCSRGPMSAAGRRGHSAAGEGAAFVHSAAEQGVRIWREFSLMVTLDLRVDSRFPCSELGSVASLLRYK